MKFVDFFAGIGGIRLGLERAGHECVGFCEFDRFARQSYKAMYDTKNEWEAHDVRTINSTDVPKADLWCFGFPCQDLSIAGKRKGLQEGERSGLFYEIIRLLQGLRQEDRPKWLLAENVKGLFSAGGGFDFLRCIVELGQLGYNIEYQLLNSKNFGVPQNRERVFIIGHLGDGSRGKVFPVRPTDGENPVSLSQIGRLVDGSVHNPQTYRVYDKEGISPTLNCMEGGNRQPMVVDAIYNNREPRVTDIAPTLRADRQGLCVGGDIVVKPVLTPEREETRQSGRRMKEDGEPMFTLTVQDRHGVAIEDKSMPRVIGGVGEVNFGKQYRQGNRVYDSNYISPALQCNSGNASGGSVLVSDRVRIRKLTPRECWRLQGFPDEYFDRAVAAGVSNSQLYRQAGNAVTVNVAEAIGRRLREIEMAVEE